MAINTLNLTIPNEVGLWIECCNKDCKKWRYSPLDDPLAVPEEWFCHMNSDKSLNTCSAPENLELPQGEVFIKSQYKAGSVVWAKVIGHPWHPGMIDYCPGLETYLWFGQPDSNIATEYHVTFFAGKRVTRAWVKRENTKPFVGNEEPKFALQAKVRGNRLTARMRKEVLEGCEFAQAALRLSFLCRFKKYTFDNWRLAQRHLELPSQHSGKETTVPATGFNKKIEKSENHPELRILDKSVADKNKRSKKSAEKKEPWQTLTKPALPKIAKPIRADEKKLAEDHELEKSSIREEKVCSDQHNETLTSEDSTKIDDELNDTRCVDSVYPHELSETLSTSNDNEAAEKYVEIKRNGHSIARILANNKLADEDIEKIVSVALKEIIPSSQSSSPMKRRPSRAKKPMEYCSIERRSQPGESSKNFGRNSFARRKSPSLPNEVVELKVEGRKIRDILIHKNLSDIDITAIVEEALLGDVSEVTARSLNSTLTAETLLNESGEAYEAEANINDHGNQQAKKKISDIEILREKIGAVSKSSELGESSKVSPKKYFKDRCVVKSASENLMSNASKENIPEESRYLRTLSEFTATAEPHHLSITYKTQRPLVRKPLPSNFLSRERSNKRAHELLSSLSAKEDEKMRQETRRLFVAEMEAKSMGLPVERNAFDWKPPNYFTQTQNNAHLMTSDEEST